MALWNIGLVSQTTAPESQVLGFGPLHSENHVRTTMLGDNLKIVDYLSSYNGSANPPIVAPLVPIVDCLHLKSNRHRHDAANPKPLMTARSHESTETEALGPLKLIPILDSMPSKPGSQCSAE